MDEYTKALSTIEERISEMTTVSPLDALSSAAALQRRADTLLQRAVESAIGTHSWAEIGAALGISKQAAHQKYVNSVAASLVEYRRQDKRARKAGDSQAREAAKASQVATAAQLRSVPRP
jgi:hypothetical protein